MERRAQLRAHRGEGGAQPAPSFPALPSLVFGGLLLVRTRRSRLSRLSLPRSISSGWAGTLRTPALPGALGGCSPCPALLLRISPRTCSLCWRLCCQHSPATDPDESHCPPMPARSPAARGRTQPPGELQERAAGKSCRNELQERAAGKSCRNGLQERAAPPEPGAVLDAPGGGWM